MQLKKTLIIALTLSIVGIIAWESYWRSQGYYPNLDDNKDLWAVQRAKVDKASKNNVLLLGSSRVLFDLQLNEWEKKTGMRPIQLASAGASPLPIFNDIVENTDYSGTIIVGVTPGLFFSTTFPMADPWKRAQSRIDHYFKRTYAQRLNHILSIPLQQNLVLMSTSEEEWSDNIDLKTLLRNIKIGNRTPEGMPPFYQFDNISLERNTEMTQKTVNDTAFANSIIKVWNFFGRKAPPPDKESTTKYFLKDAKKFLARDGNLIVVRLPSSGGNRMAENKFLSREKFWDSLVGLLPTVKNYHFEDYEQLKHLTCPEESHLSKEDAEYFTSELAKIMIEDKAITNQKIN
jgi:hypothetical protein